MARDTSCRKWQITINNPEKHGFDHVKIKSILEDKFVNLLYWCMCDEVGEKEGTEHTHIYLIAKNQIQFSNMQERFFGAHLEMARGTSQQNRDYIRKEGKYELDKKHHTNKIETFEEWGEMPAERQGARNDLEQLYTMIKEGFSNYDIMEENPEFLLNIDKVERCRQIVKEERYKDQFRIVNVSYLFGQTGSGKTRSIMEKYGYSNVFRVTDYEHPFDGYKGQDVIIFEEFRSSLKIQDMLNYLDGYPLELPCRYTNKIACFTKIYIITNIDIDEQYRQVQITLPETWQAFLRRINYINYYYDGGINEFIGYEDYKKRYIGFLLSQKESEKVREIFA